MLSYASIRARLALCTLIASISIGEVNAQSYYPILCRAPFTIELSKRGGVPGMWIAISANATAAGERGERLDAGKCAYANRPLRSTAPDRIRYVLSDSIVNGVEISNDRSWRAGIITLITSCSATPNCVLEEYVQAVGLSTPTLPRGWYRARPSPTAIYP